MSAPAKIFHHEGTKAHEGRAPDLRAPFPWFGGKRPVADVVWRRFGDVRNYVEPFFGSGAVLLGRPEFTGTETVNDKDGFLSNFWRALQADPEGVARYADWPVNEADLHARHVWLVAQRDTMTARLMGDPDYHDAKIAGWWVWGLCSWIGSGWCSGKGPWYSVDGKLVKMEGNAGQGVNRQLPHLGDAGQGVNRQLPHLGNAGKGVNRKHGELAEYMRALSARMENVRVACGDWQRVMGGSVTFKHGLTGVFLDPPYTPEAGWFGGAYSSEGSVAHDVAQWCRENGDNPKLRIALCGYEGEHDMPADWECFAWKARGGYGANNGNPDRERIWFSPHCVGAEQAQQELAI